MKAYSEEFHTLPNGMRILPHNPFHIKLVYPQIFEEESYLKYGISIRQGNTLFDIGANIGFFALYASTKAQPLSIYAFEPILATYNELKENLLLNSVKAKTFNLGLAEKAGEKLFTFFPEMSGMSGSLSSSYTDAKIFKKMMMQHLQGFNYPERKQELEDDIHALGVKLFSTEESHTCTVTTLSEIIQKEAIAVIDLLKIDVERAELDVLHGIQQKDWRKIKQIVLETHTAPLKEAVVNLLEKQGYDIVVETRKNDALLAEPSIYQHYTLAMVYAKQHMENTPGRKTTVIEKNIPQLSIHAQDISGTA